MKHLLTIILILTWMVGIGQTTHVHSNTTLLRTSFYMDSINDPNHYDTIPVIMLVCDTTHDSISFLIYDTVTINIWSKAIRHIKCYRGIQDDRVFWMNGYEVVEPYVYIGGPDVDPGQNIVTSIATRSIRYKHIKLLNENKQPLKPEYIIWDYKGRKQ